MEMEWTESEIQSLKAQEAKDLAVELLHQLEAKEQGPISPAEVQIRELDFELRLREAEQEDRRRHEMHERQIKELELQIEQERTKCAAAENQADQVRASFASVIQRVEEADQSLSIQLDRATREHNLKLEQLEASYAARQDRDLSEFWRSWNDSATRCVTRSTPSRICRWTLKASASCGRKLSDARRRASTSTPSWRNNWPRLNSRRPKNRGNEAGPGTRVGSAPGTTSEGYPSRESGGGRFNSEVARESRRTEERVGT